ncbi:hypothetical protein E2C01_052005 [Portunus trituberculatus]|uniref:Uncharacterized protein n=1 Tax=Portunus trituberculatus TaxID=210409 RepID=A0A5B7GKJ4_PORTR|nr:hypothetical protein [Portunus trituberculatus]
MAERLARYRWLPPCAQYASSANNVQWLPCVRRFIAWSGFQQVVSYWLKIVALTCVYPLVLLTARPRDVWPPLMATLRRLSQWQEGGGGPCRWQRRGQGAAEQQDVRLSSLDAHPPSDKNASFKLSRPPSPSNGDKDASVTRL